MTSSEPLSFPSLPLHAPRRELSYLLTSSEERALPADHSNLGTHVLASLLNCQVSLLIDVDDGDCGLQALTPRGGGDNSSDQHCRGKREGTWQWSEVEQNWKEFYLPVFRNETAPLNLVLRIYPQNSGWRKGSRSCTVPLVAVGNLERNLNTCLTAVCCWKDSVTVSFPMHGSNQEWA